MIDQETFDTDMTARRQILKKILNVAERYVFDSMTDSGVDPYDPDLDIAMEVKETMIRLLDTWQGIEWGGDGFLSIEAEKRVRRGGDITVTTRLSPDDYRRLVAHASDMGLTTSEVVRMLILARIDKVKEIKFIT